MYLALQILQTTLGAGTFSSAYIFGKTFYRFGRYSFFVKFLKAYFFAAAELVGPKYRVMTSAFSSSMFSVGQVILGGVAWLVQPWRYMIMALHIPCFLIISYYWLLPESIRWLLSKNKNEEARKVLENVARVNKKSISEKSIQALMFTPEGTDNNTNVSITYARHNKVLNNFLRFIIACIEICDTFYLYTLKSYHVNKQ